MSLQSNIISELVSIYLHRLSSKSYRPSWMASMIQVIIMVHGSNDGSIHAAGYAWNSKNSQQYLSSRKEKRLKYVLELLQNKQQPNYLIA